MMMSCGVFKLQSLPAVLCGKLWFVGASTVKSVAVCRAAVNQQKRYFSLSTASGGNRPDEKLMVHFINRDNEKLTVPAKEGESLLDVVIKNNLDLDGFGACEGTLACSTCHIIFDKEVFENLDEITDEEMDMLDLAFGLTSTCLSNSSKQDEEKWWECCCDPRLISKKCKPTRGMETDHDRRSDAPIPPHLKAADNILDVPEEWIQRHPCSVTSIRLMSQTTRSRLGCQICLKKSLDGITVKIPKEVSDVRESKGQ